MEFNVDNKKSNHWIYQPEEKITAKITGNTTQKVIEDSVISLVTWNIGFGGLGAKDLFFYDANGTLISKNPVISPKENFDAF